MSSHELERLTPGQGLQIAGLLEAILEELRRPVEWGGVADLRRVYWDPANSPPGPVANVDYDGVFRSIGIFNLSSGVADVSFTPGFALVDRESLFTLSARGFIVLPYRGVVSAVSVSGAAAGSALIAFFDQPQPVHAGTF